jgi:hypothetical protein
VEEMLRRLKLLMHGEVSDGGVAHATVEAPHEAPAEANVESPDEANVESPDEANVESPDEAPHEVLDETKPINCG